MLWEQKIVPSFRTQSGLLFVRNGFVAEEAGVNVETRLDYIQIPVIAKVKVGPVYGLGGITGGYRVGATSVVNDVKTKLKKENLNRLDFGAQVGFGFKVLFFGIEGRYNWGLSNVSKVEGQDFKNKYFQLGVHFML